MGQFLKDFFDLIYRNYYYFWITFLVISIYLNRISKYDKCNMQKDLRFYPLMFFKVVYLIRAISKTS